MALRDARPAGSGELGHKGDIDEIIIAWELVEVNSHEPGHENSHEPTFYPTYPLNSVHISLSVGSKASSPFIAHVRVGALTAVGLKCRGFLVHRSSDEHGKRNKFMRWLT